MARKATGSTPTPRKRKTIVQPETVVPPTDAQVSPEIAQSAIAPETTAKIELNMDEEIRRRAYEIYLQRNGEPGDPHMDWLIAEREVRSRHNGQPLGRAAAQGRN